MFALVNGRGNEDDGTVWRNFWAGESPNATESREFDARMPWDLERERNCAVATFEKTRHKGILPSPSKNIVEKENLFLGTAGSEEKNAGRPDDLLSTNWQQSCMIMVNSDKSPG
jgi:hypothetical protein